MTVARNPRSNLLKTHTQPLSFTAIKQSEWKAWARLGHRARSKTSYNPPARSPEEIKSTPETMNHMHFVTFFSWKIQILQYVILLCPLCFLQYGGGGKIKRVVKKQPVIHKRNNMTVQRWGLLL